MHCNNYLVFRFVSEANEGMVEFTLKFTQWAQGLNSMHEDFNVQFSLRVFHSLHNTTVKMSEEVVLFMFCTFFIDVKVADLSEVKLYIILIQWISYWPFIIIYFYCYLLFRFIQRSNEGKIKFTLKFTQWAWGMNIKSSRNGSDHILYLFIEIYSKSSYI